MPNRARKSVARGRGAVRDRAPVPCGGSGDHAADAEASTLSFGAGAHYCLGAAPARLEGQRGLAMLLDRFGDIRLAEPPGTPRQLMLRGHEQLWLTLSRR
jgi:cytochrome P450